MSKWVLLHNTAVRESDIRRIEMVSTSAVISFTITFRGGGNMHLNVDQKGGDWCLKAMEAGKKNSAAATDAFNEESDESEFSE